MPREAVVLRRHLMAAVDPIQVVEAAYRKMEAHFWYSVAETLDRVFANGTQQAAEFRRQLVIYRSQLSQASAEEQLLVYNSEPLDVAADLAGAKVTSEHISAYRSLIHAPAETESDWNLAESPLADRLFRPV